MTGYSGLLTLISVGEVTQSLVPFGNMTVLSDIKIRSREQRLRQGFSFCIITAGKRPAKLNRLIDSIRRQNLDVFEIIVAGNMENPIEGINYLPLIQEAASGRVSVLRNRAMQSARYDTIVMSDDDIVLDDGFAEAIAQYEQEFDLLCVKMRNPDGSRCWDWATIGGPTGHRLMSDEETDDFVYVSSGIFVISKKTLSLGYFNEQLGFGEGEDVEFSQRLKSKGARIELCKTASVLHDDSRYTQFDDYTRRICDFNSWEAIAPGVEARGLYQWDGQTYPLSQETQFKLTNKETEPKSFCFTIISLPAYFSTLPWKCTVSAEGVPLLELMPEKQSTLAMLVNPGSTRFISLKCSDVVVGFSEGAFRDQRAIGASLLKPIVRSPQEGDIELPAASGNFDFSLLNQGGISLFAPCMAFGHFAASSRALLRYLEAADIPYGLELHSVDYWFSRQCLRFTSSADQWSQFLKRRRYSGINLVCAEADRVAPGFFRRAQISRPGYSNHIAVTTASDRPDIIEELKAYNSVMVFNQADARALAEHAVYASVITPGGYFPEGQLSIQHTLPGQRSKAVTIVVDQTSDYGAELSGFLDRYGPDEDVSIVLYVVDGLETVRKVTYDIENYYKSSGHTDRMLQTIVWAGTLEAIEELEYLRFSRERINLLSFPLADHLEHRLSA